MQAGVIGKDKWIPDILPPSSKDIRARRNIDTLEGWLSFNFDPAENSSILQSCQQIVEACVLLPNARRSRRISWWPRNLVDGMDDSLKKASGYAYYQCGGKEYQYGTLALGVEKNKAFYWDIGNNKPVSEQIGKK
jgi:hypothetical protein